MGYLERRFIATVAGVFCVMGAHRAPAQTQTVRVPGIEAPLHWDHAPLSSQVTNTGIVITAPGKSDKYVAAWGGYVPDNAPRLVFDDSDENFVLSAKVSHSFAGRWDSGGIFVEADAAHWFKFEFERDYTNAHRVVSVVTNEYSDDVNAMAIDADSYYFQVAKAGDVFYQYVSKDGESWYLVRTLHFKAAGPLKVGLIAQCPEGNGATITFSEVKYSRTKIKDMWKGK